MSKIHILIAEDDPVIRIGVRHVLERIGYKVTDTSDGYQALNIILENHKKGSPPFDLILIDFQMPILNGIELLTELKQRKIHLPVLTMAGCITDQTLSILQKNNIELQFIAKPFSPEELVRKIKTLVKEDISFSHPSEEIFRS